MSTHHCLHARRLPKSAGFTLVELVVTMVIAAILAAIAIPAYSNYVRKAHRTEAKSSLLDLASLEERFYSTNNAYTDIATNLGYTGTGVGYTTANGSFSVGSGYYTVVLTQTPAGAPTNALPGGTPATYTVVATAVGDQLKDTSCKTFTVTTVPTVIPQSSQDSSAVDSTATCWR